VVDLCIAPLAADGSYDRSPEVGRPYRRFLIDTGIEKTGHLENIKRVLKTFKQPLVVTTSGGTDNPGTPYVDMFQAGLCDQ
jgi:RNA 3'-terminal phosphate cyclase